MKGKIKLKKKNFLIFYLFGLQKNSNVTFIPSLIWRSEHNWNFESNKKSKNAAHLPSPYYLSVSVQFGWIGKGGLGSGWISNALFSSLQPTKQRKYNPFPTLPAKTHPSNNNNNNNNNNNFYWTKWSNYLFH